MSKAIARAGIDTGDSSVNCGFDHDLLDNTSTNPGEEPDTISFTTTFESESGATTVRINGYAAAIVDEGITSGKTDCVTNGTPTPHDTIATKGSDTVFFEGSPVHRVGDEGEIVGADGKYDVAENEGDVLAG